MVRARLIPFVRHCLAALLALGLMLNGMGGALAATAGRPEAATVVIAGMVVTICQFGDGDTGGKQHPGHACDQCALRLAPALPQASALASLIRFPQIFSFGPASRLHVLAALDRRQIWPRGPPIA
ncbi:hypothetical protein [Labrys neptuniae]